MRRKKVDTVTTKMTPASLTNFRQAAAITGEKQYEIIEEASKDVLDKISAKIKQAKNAPNSSERDTIEK